MKKIHLPFRISVVILILLVTNKGGNVMAENSLRLKFPDTGVNRCYDQDGKEIGTLKRGEQYYGQDGCFLINPLSFTKLSAQEKELPDSALWQDGLRMVLDNNTGLMWEVKSPQPGDLNYQGDRYSWEDAQNLYVKKLNKKNYGGFSDWRIPNKDELRSIVDYANTNPAVDLWYFPNCQVDFYWCNATYEMQPYFGWGIFFGLGSGIIAGKSNACHVRAVRSGYNQKFGNVDSGRFIDNGDRTVTDTVTGLMWQKEENERMNWYDSMNHCAKMDLAGYTDWRLPNIKELNTILNLNYDDGWWYYKDFFPATGLVPPLLHYYSSTPHENYYVWVTNFCFGYDGYYASKSAPLLHRAVRNINPAPELKKLFVIPDTGQGECYDDEGNHISAPQSGEKFYGQDGSYNINPFSFTKLRENAKTLDDNASWAQGLRMVRDNNTGLIWEIKSPQAGDFNYKDDQYNFADAAVYIDRLNKNNYGGFSDWRLPNREEFRTIVDYSGRIPAVDTNYFPHCLPKFYWAKDRYAADKKMVWGIYFAYGCSICYLDTNLYQVRAVRGGHNQKFGDKEKYAFQDNKDGTITDLNTGLMWKQEESPEMNFKDALQYCEELTLGGYHDWRLPNIKEIATLLDLSCKDRVWFHKDFFPEVKTKPLGFYWASTTYGASLGWGVNFQFAYDGYYAGKKHGKYCFRPVRNLR